MLTDESIKRISVVVQNKHMKNSHSVNEVELTVNLSSDTINDLKTHRKFGKLFPAKGDCFRRYIGRQKVKSLQEKRMRITPLAAANL